MPQSFLFELVVCTGPEPVADAMVRNFVSDKTLGLSRAPSAFAWFLADFKGKGRVVRRRLRRKTFVWRMDLMARRFKLLDSTTKQKYLDMSRESHMQKAARRRELMRGSPCGPTAHEAVQEEPTSQASAVAEISPAEKRMRRNT